MYYFDILKIFFDNKIEYIIIGGLAVNLHGVPRVTQDIDILICMKKKNILKINKILQNLDYVSRLPVDPDQLVNDNIREKWIKEKNLKAFSFYHKKDNYKIINIVLISPIDYKTAFMHKIVKRVADIEINLIDLDDLIKLKTFSGREQDLSDVKLLKKVKQLS
ncbi:MAG: hypothetical protein KAT05_01595 [Spirochaetes bacterium]|nr:hypothetical protein [Spirochaetota bacterium]